MTTGGPRARARKETIDQIKTIARHQLSSEGPDLSLRAIARELGVVSSAVYRYFPSRDALLTALIIDGYNELGACVEEAEAQVPRRELVARWLAIGHTTREWALANPAMYALLYGSPIPGYAAPEDTIGPATRTVRVMLALLRDGVSAGVLAPRRGERLAKPVRADLEALVAAPGFEGIPPAILMRGMSGWAHLYGAISFELFGRLTNAVHDYAAYFDQELRMIAANLGL